MCLLPAMAAGLVKPKTAALGMLSPAAAVMSAMGGTKKSKPMVTGAPNSTQGGY